LSWNLPASRLRTEIRKRIDFGFNQEISVAAPEYEVVYEDEGISISLSGNPSGIKSGTGQTPVWITFKSESERRVIFQEHQAVLLRMK
jgi:hypothetical protein